MPMTPDTARQRLAAAGAGEQTLTLDIPTQWPDEAQRLAQMMTAQYAAVNLHTEIVVHADRPAYAAMVRAKGIHDACCFDSSPLSTYRILREKFHSGVQGPWWQGYHRPEVNALIDLAAETVELTRRRALYQQAYRLIHEDAPWIFLYNPLLAWGFHPTVDAPLQVDITGLLLH